MEEVVGSIPTRSTIKSQGPCDLALFLTLCPGKVGPVIPATQVGQFVQHDVFEFRIRESIEESSRDKDRLIHEPQVVRNGFRSNTKFLNDRALVIDSAGSTAQLDDTCASDALGEILIWSTDDDTLNLRILRGRGCGRCQSIVRLKFHHRPNYDSGCGENILKERKLSQKVGINSFAGFVSRPQGISKRFDDMVRRHPDVGDASLQHAQQGGKHTPHRTHLAPFVVACMRQREKVAKKLVRAVYQVYFHDSAQLVYTDRGLPAQ
jgi:hypothetical protein